MLRILILALALGAGGLAAWMVTSMQLSTASATVNTPPAPQPSTVEVLVAATDLPQGHSLKEESLSWRAWPKDALNPGFITRAAHADAVASLKDSVVRSQFVASEPIREEKLARISSGLLAAILPPGKRAVAIRVSAENTAGGFILPNDRVDVIQTITKPGQDGSMSGNLSRTILRNIRVLAVDQNADDPKGQTVVGKTATLELSPDQAEAVATGQITGVLSLALRSVADSMDEPVLVLEKGNSVRIMRAGQVEIVKVQ
jgi:pilus assembly protein CpaB